ncbi:hypothetical protein TIFTF001_012119 [Ficus carica]|uniref:Calcineurin B-like protein n=1 Tax=Ficus carica TaxID=3494 RepID=A0AA88DI06_FICCA|nr:hypothetical protein TIFTF001_012119 [Ficus carica]
MSTEMVTSEFGEFVQALSIFHPKTPEEVKIKSEGDGAGFLNESDLILSDDVVEMIVDKTFKEADAKGDGKIDEEEWKDETHDGDGNFSFTKRMLAHLCEETTKIILSFLCPIFPLA